MEQQVPDIKKGIFGLTQSSITTILTGAFLVGAAWTKLSAVEASVKSIADEIGAVNKAQMELQLNEKLLEARVLTLEQQQSSTKHR